MTGLIVALDTGDLAQARRWAEAAGPHCAMVKLGLEFFSANGPEGVEALGQWPVFLDLKLHDIPNTVAGAMRSLLPLRPRMVTVHANGGSAMIRAARQAAERDGSCRPIVLAVTVLTSLGEAELAELGVDGGVEPHVLRLARLAMQAGADGVVCSPLEVARLRAELGPDAILVVPGIRPFGAATDDQARAMTPENAAVAGADWIVVGRPITGAPDPGAAAKAVAGALA